MYFVYRKVDPLFGLGDENVLELLQANKFLESSKHPLYVLNQRIGNTKTKYKDKLKNIIIIELLDYVARPTNTVKL